MENGISQAPSSSTKKRRYSSRPQKNFNVILNRRKERRIRLLRQDFTHFELPFAISRSVGKSTDRSKKKLTKYRSISKFTDDET